MDQAGFDRWARRLAGDRRGVLKAAASGALAAVAALARPGGEAAALRCRVYGDACERDRQCCSEQCAGRRCDCRAPGGNCVVDGRRVDRACCSNRCQRNGRCA